MPSQTLAEHDKKYHPEGFDPEKDTCKFREQLSKADKADEVEEVEEKASHGMSRVAESFLAVNEDKSGCDKSDGKLHTHLADGIDPKSEEAREVAYKQAEDNIHLLREIVSAAAYESGGEASFRPPNEKGAGVDDREVGKSIKRRVRVDEKAANDYQGDYSRVTDLIGGTITLPKDGSVGRLLDALRAHLPDDTTIAQVKKLSSPEAGGYWDLKASIRFPNGGIGEVIIADKDILDAKMNRGGHNLYDFQRSLEKYEDEDESAAELLDALGNLEKGIYSHRTEAAAQYQGEAWDRAKASASDSLTRFASFAKARSLSLGKTLEKLSDLLSQKSLQSPELPASSGSYVSSKATPARSLIQKGMPKSPLKGPGTSGAKTAASVSHASSGVNIEPLLPGFSAQDAEDEDADEEDVGDCPPVWVPSEPLLPGFGGDAEGVAEDALSLGKPVESAASPKVQSLMDHDAKYHPNGYKEGSHCKFRDKLGMSGIRGYTPKGGVTKASPAAGGGGVATQRAGEGGEGGEPEGSGAAARARTPQELQVLADLKNLGIQFKDDAETSAAVEAIAAGLEIDLLLDDLGLKREGDIGAEASPPEGGSGESPAPLESAPQPTSPAPTAPADQPEGGYLLGGEKPQPASSSSSAEGEEKSLRDGVREGLDAVGLTDIGIKDSIDSPGFVSFVLDVPLDMDPKAVEKAFTAIGRATKTIGKGLMPSVSYMDDGSVAISIPKEKSDPVPLADAFDSPEYQKAVQKSPHGVVVPLCKDSLGRWQFTDIMDAPHVGVFGTTGSGKSVFLNSLVASIVRMYGGKARVGIIEGKGTEFKPFDRLTDKSFAHKTVHGDVDEALGIVKALDAEQERRNRIISEATDILNAAGIEKDIKNFKDYNALPADAKAVLEQQGFPSRMEPIVEIIDEYANIRSRLGKKKCAEFDDAIKRVLQKARSAGICCVIATQSPLVDEIPGDQQKLLPAKATFKTTQNLPGQVEGKDLRGKGDMRFTVGPKNIRGQSSFVDESKLRDFLPAQSFKTPRPAPSAAPQPSPTPTAQPTSPAPTSPAPQPTTTPATQPATPATTAPSAPASTTSIQNARNALQHLSGNPVIALVLNLLDQAEQSGGSPTSQVPTSPTPQPLPQQAPQQTVRPSDRQTVRPRVKPPASAQYPRTEDGRIDISGLPFWKGLVAAFRLGLEGYSPKNIKTEADAPPPKSRRAKAPAPQPAAPSPSPAAPALYV